MVTIGVAYIEEEEVGMDEEGEDIEDDDLTDVVQY